METINGRGQRLRFGVFEADLLARELYKRGTLVRVQDKPFQMLTALLEHPGEVVTREELRRRLWPDGTFVDFEKGLNTAAKKLRTTLGDSSDSPIFIETIPRRGYRFIAPIILDHSGYGQGNLQTANPSEITQTPSPNFGDVPTHEQQELSSRWGRRKYALVTLCVTLIIVVGLFVLRFRWRVAVSSRPTMELTQLTNSGNAQTAGISPDGRYVAYAQVNREGYSLRLRQVATSSDVEILSSEPGLILGITFSPDGQYIYFVRADKKDWAFIEHCII
jgi:DNA-binding winged helix-turn-helix (wHTH) protein